ncbi:hypothetical protein BTA51_12855 [Hahella sp. CCB-MM4]|uniref:hypothetical protein n=1 Tax=Hahella sp. (strain CCB-MM4) TaxID=1926491 RepID=UPI000B9C3432|nr:hypothetical protein [Hahella sp. CCB-MM4]OZG72858.1 hypothetical protein BTA51_12855 [Hahella sp. CCB-MM4]
MNTKTTKSSSKKIAKSSRDIPDTILDTEAPDTKAKEPPPEQPSQAVQPDEVQAESQLSAIRDLLYGAQVRQINLDIDTLAEKMNDRMQQLSDKLEQSIQELNSTFSAKLDDLGKHLESLNKQRCQREDDLSADIDDLRNKLNEAHQESEQADRALHDELQAEADRLTREMARQHSQAMAELKKSSQELSSNKADRKTLANLLASMADNLTTDKVG